MKPKRWVIRKSDSDVTKVLIMARRRIKDPKHWTTIVAARDAKGSPVSCCHVSARAWCAVGSLYASIGAFPGNYTVATRATEALFDASKALQFVPNVRVMTYMPVMHINDELGHDAVIDMYDKAIEQSRQ